MNFWENPDWVKAKTINLKTEKLLSRVEYLKMFGWKEYSDEKYSKYLEIMKQQPKEQDHA